MQSEIISRLRTIIAEAEADIAQDYADAETTGERPDLHDNEITLSLEYAKALEAALSDAEPVGYTDASELSNDTGHGLFAYAQSDTSWLVGNPIALYTAAPAPSVAVKATPEALEQFTAYFVKNYPGPDTVIFDPKWHAPKIFRAAVSALSAQVQDVAGWQPIETAPKDGTRLLLMWEPFSGMSEHVELGKWNVRNGWVNTYGHAFSGSPTHFMPLPAAPAKQEG